MFVQVSECDRHDALGRIVSEITLPALADWKLRDGTVGPAFRSESFQNRTVVPQSSFSPCKVGEVARVSGSA